MEEILLCEKIGKTFIVKDFLGINKRKVVALNNITLSIKKGLNLGIVGESGSGKTTLAKIMLLLIRPDTGKIYYKGTDITRFSDSKLRFFRRKIRIIFQNPYKSLNPRLTVEKTILEAIPSKNKTSLTVEEILQQTGLPGHYKNKYPHQMSGGERQRVAIARAIAGNPECIIADEPTGNLDATTEIHILNLLNNLKKELGITFVFISHNLKIVEKFCERLVVMYRGNIVEEGSSEQISKSPLHPYTKLLWNPELIKDGKDTEERSITGCPFFSRCIYRKDICFNSFPWLKEKEKNHLVSCFLYE